MEPSRGKLKGEHIKKGPHTPRVQGIQAIKILIKKTENHNHHLPVSQPVCDEERCDQHTSTSHSPPSLPSPGMFFKAILIRFLAPAIS